MEKGFIPKCVKFSGLQRVPQALLYLHVGEEGLCCLGLGRGDSCCGLAGERWQIERLVGLWGRQCLSSGPALQT